MSEGLILGSAAPVPARLSGDAPVVARRFTVVCADLRGYGRGGRPTSAPDHAPCSMRAMAREMVEARDSLAFPREAAPCIAPARRKAAGAKLWYWVARPAGRDSARPVR